MMRCAIISDTYFPDRNSAANLLSDLVNFSKKNLGIQFDIYTVSTACEDHNDPTESVLKYEKDIKNRPYAVRAMLEILSGIYFCYLYLKERRKVKYDAVLYYNPTILQITFIFFLKVMCRNAVFVLILRDIFPDWAVEIGLIRSKVVKYLFSSVKAWNIRSADIVYCESSNKLKHVIEKFPATRVELLHNWVDFSELDLKVRQVKDKRLIYAGNVGPAQSITSCNTFINLLTEAGYKIDFYSEGRELNKLCETFKYNDRIKFFEQVPQKTLDDLLPRYNGGLVFLAQDLVLDNIPGKILTYLRHGLPVFGAVNLGNEIVSLITENELGALVDNRASVNSKAYSDTVSRLCDGLQSDKIKINSSRIFGVEAAAKRIFNDIKNCALKHNY